MLNDICNVLKREKIVRRCPIRDYPPATPYISILHHDQERFLRAIRPFVRTEKKCKQIDDALKMIKERKPRKINKQEALLL